MARQRGRAGHVGSKKYAAARINQIDAHVSDIDEENSDIDENRRPQRHSELESDHTDDDQDHENAAQPEPAAHRAQASVARRADATIRAGMSSSERIEAFTAGSSLWLQLNSSDVCFDEFHFQFGLAFVLQDITNLVLAETTF